MVRYGKAVEARTGGVSSGLDRFDRLRYGSFGMVRLGKLRCGSVGVAWSGLAVEAWHGRMGYGAVRRGVAW